MENNNVPEKGCCLIGNYKVDLGTNTISLEGASRQVEPKAMHVLYVLACNAGETVSRTELLRTVWGERVVVEEALTRTISQLRNVFSDNKSRQTIQTVPKKGYRLNAEVVWQDGKKPNNDRPQSTDEITKPSLFSSFRSFIPFLILAIVIAFFWLSQNSDQKHSPEDTSATQQTNLSIAVLPLSMLSSDEQTLYLAEGIPEELLGTLAKLPELYVPSRYSTFAYAKQDKNLTDIAKTLNVRYVLEGSVRKLNDQFKITVRLVDSKSNRTIWSESYEDSVSRLFDIQTDIARNVVAILLPEQKNAISKVGQTDIDSADAYQHYLQGNYWLMNGKTSEWFYRAEAAFLKSIENDPNYAAAQGSLAYLYARHNYHDTYIPTHIAVPKAKQAITNALSLQPDEINALLALAILTTSEGEFTKAEEALNKALSTYPDHPTTLYLYSELELARNQFAQALNYANKAKQVDPLSPWINVNLAIVHFWRGEFEQASQAANMAINIDDKYTWAYVWQARIYQSQGKLAEAVKAMEKCLEIDSSSRTNNAYLGLLYIELGMPEQAQVWFEKTATLYGDSTDARFWQGFIRFAYHREDDEIAKPMLQNLALLENRLFSLVPLLQQMYSPIMESPEQFWLPRIQNASGDIFVNYRNQHSAYAALGTIAQNTPLQRSLSQKISDYEHKLSPKLSAKYFYSSLENNTTSNESFELPNGWMRERNK